MVKWRGNVIAVRFSLYSLSPVLCRSEKLRNIISFKISTTITFVRAYDLITVQCRVSTLQAVRFRLSIHVSFLCSIFVPLLKCISQFRCVHIVMAHWILPNNNHQKMELACTTHSVRSIFLLIQSLCFKLQSVSFIVRWPCRPLCCIRTHFHFDSHRSDGQFKYILLLQFSHIYLQW